MRLLLVALLGALLVCPLTGQIPRETVLVGNPAGEAQGVAIDSYGDLCAILFKDGADQSIRLVRADGRALFFAAVPRVDAGTGQLKEIFPDSLAIPAI
jgi:hypothetical protein